MPSRSLAPLFVRGAAVLALNTAGCSAGTSGGDADVSRAAPTAIANDAAPATKTLDAAVHALPPTATDPDASSGDAKTGSTEAAAPGAFDAELASNPDAAGPSSLDAWTPSPFDAGEDASPPVDSAVNDAAIAPTLGAAIASLALSNVGLGACSTNTSGGVDFESSCTGNDGSPEYWCADFVQWVWQQAGVDVEGLDAAAGTFYTYGENFGTLHQTPTLGDAVVFNYAGGAYADHVAIVTLVNADGTIETVSGDWNGVGATEAAFSSTSVVFHNLPAFAATVGSTPAPIGMVLAGFITPVPLGSAPLTGNDVLGAGCYSSTLGKQMPDNACVQSSSDDTWYQCNDGEWAARDSVAWACNGEFPL